MNEPPRARCRFAAGQETSVCEDTGYVVLCKSYTVMYNFYYSSVKLKVEIDLSFLLGPSYAILFVLATSNKQAVCAGFAAHWIPIDDYLMLNHPFCSAHYQLLSAWLWFCLLCQRLSGSLSLWRDCTLMSIRAMASHTASVLWKCNGRCWHIVRYTQTLFLPWECLFDLTDMHCQRDVWTKQFIASTLGAESNTWAGRLPEPLNGGYLITWSEVNIISLLLY